MKFFSDTINGDLWNVYLVSDSDNVAIDEDAAASIDLLNKEIFFRESECSIETVRHELFHLYVDYCFIGTANLDQDQMEEVACELFSYRADQILKKAEQIHTKLMELKHASKS